MSLRRPLIAAATALAGLAAGEQPLAELRFEGPRLAQHWPASVYARMWNDPAAATLRAKFDEGLAAAKAATGLDLLALVAALRVHGRLDSLMPGPGGPGSPPKAGFHVQADLGDQAAAAFEQFMKNADGSAKPLAVAGADAAMGDENVVIARIGRTVVVAPAGTPPAPKAMPPAVDDIAGSVDLTRLFDAVLPLVPAEARAEFEANVATMRTWYQGRVGYRANLVPEGVVEVFSNDAPAQTWMRPVDRALLDRLPANALIAGAMGIDGAEYWKLMRPVIINAMRQDAARSGGEMTEEQAAMAMDSGLKSFGVNATVADLISGLTGTSLLAITPGMPFPAATIAVPRSAAMDQVVGVLLAQMQTAMPAEGAAATVVVPNVGIAVQALRAAGHWVLTSDPAVAAGWSGAPAGAWRAAAAGRLALEKAPADAWLVGASDTPAVLRSLLPYAGMALAFAQDLPPADRNAIVQVITRLAGMTGTGYVVAGTRDKAQITELRGLFGVLALPILGSVMGATRAVRVVEAPLPPGFDDAAAAPEPKEGPASVLKNNLYPAQILFQSGAYQDADGDNVGEYGLLSEICGRRAAGQVKPGELNFVAGALAKSDQADGWRYAGWLPDGAGGAIGEPDGTGARPVKAAAADGQERRFVIYAWPAAAGAGAQVYALTSDGQVRSAPFSGEPPAWNGVFGGKGWDAAPVWAPQGK